MSATIVSTFENIINEFCEVATWINSQLLDSKNLNSTNYKIITNRIDALQPTAEKYESSFRNGDIVIDESLLIRFENLYSTLWNTITLLLKNDYDTDGILFLCKCQLFTAIQLSVYNSLSKNNMSYFNCFVVVMKSLVNNIKHDNESINEIEDEIFKITKTHIDFFTNTFVANTTDKNLQNSLIEAYVCLFQSYIQRNDTDTARIYLQKIEIDKLPKTVTPKTILEISRIIYNSSLHIYKKNSKQLKDVLQDIIMYLDKSLLFITTFVNDIKTHIDYIPLRYSILSLLIQCMIEKPQLSSEEQQRASNLLEQLQIEYPKKSMPFQLHVKFLKYTKCENMSDMIASVIMQMILNIDITKNIDSLINTINEFSEISTKHAVKSLDYLFQNKIDAMNDQIIFERVILTRFYTTLQSKNLNETEMIENLFEFYKLMEQIISKPLSRTSVSSIVTLLWSSGKKIEKTESYVLCSKFYELALKEIISGSYGDRGKLQRALVNSYILSNDLSKAEEILNTMSSQDKNHPLTTLLHIKLSLVLQNVTEIPKLFQFFSQSSNEMTIEVFILALNEVRNYPELLIDGATLLFKLLHRLNDSIGHIGKGKWDLSIVSLIRFTIQSVLKLTEEVQDNLDVNIKNVITLLEEPLKYFKELKAKKDLNILEDESFSNETSFNLTVDDIEWFASTAYNVGSTILRKETQLRDSFECISLANKYLELIPYADFTFTKMYHFNYWGYRCRAQMAVIKYQMLETQLGIEIDNTPKLQNLELEMLIQDIITFIKTAIPSNLLSTEQIDELEILVIEICHVSINVLINESKIEAITNLLSIELIENQDDLDECLAQCLINRDHVPMELRRSFIMQLIHRGLDSNKCNITKICYWIRIIFTDYNGKVGGSEYSVLERTSGKLKGNIGTHSTRSSEEELDIETISSICWNIGINCLISEERNEFIKWAKLAYQFSRYARVGLDQQMRNLLNSLLSTGQVSDGSTLANIFDE